MSPRRLAAVAAACVLFLTGCSTNGGPGCGGGSPTTDAGSGILDGGPTATAGPASAPPVTLPSSAEQYTKEAIAAWAAHDAGRLDQYESSDGVLHSMMGCNGCYNTAFNLAPGF